MRARLKQWLEREDRSASWLSRRLADEGCNVAPTAIWRTLNEGRRITVAEGVAISRVTGIPLHEFVQDFPPSRQQVPRRVRDKATYDETWTQSDAGRGTS